jgi:hypothetical protein
MNDAAAEVSFIVYIIIGRKTLIFLGSLSSLIHAIYLSLIPYLIIWTVKNNRGGDFSILLKVFKSI